MISLSKCLVYVTEMQPRKHVLTSIGNSACFHVSDRRSLFSFPKLKSLLRTKCLFIAKIHFTMPYNSKLSMPRNFGEVSTYGVYVGVEDKHEHGVGFSCA